MANESPLATPQDELRERIARALYDHEPKFVQRLDGSAQKRGWSSLYVSERGAYLRRADVVLDALGLEQVGWMWPAFDDWHIGWKREGDNGRPEDVPLYRLAPDLSDIGDAGAHDATSGEAGQEPSPNPGGQP